MVHTYGEKQQFVDEPDTLPPLSKLEKTFVQEVTGVFLYYVRALNCTMLPALDNLPHNWTTPTKKLSPRFDNS